MKKAITIVVLLVLGTPPVTYAEAPEPSVLTRIRAIDMETHKSIEALCYFRVKGSDETFGYTLKRQGIDTGEHWLAALHPGDVLYLQIFAEGYVPSLEQVIIPYPTEDNYTFTKSVKMYPREKPEIDISFSKSGNYGYDVSLTLELGSTQSWVNPSQKKFGHDKFPHYISKRMWTKPWLVIESSEYLWNINAYWEFQYIDRQLSVIELAPAFRSSHEYVFHIEPEDFDPDMNISMVLYESCHIRSGYLSQDIPKTEKPFDTFHWRNGALSQNENISIVSEEFPVLDNVSSWPYQSEVYPYVPPPDSGTEIHLELEVWVLLFIIASIGGIGILWLVVYVIKEGD